MKDYISTYVFVNIRKAMIFFTRWNKFVALRGISCFAFSAVEFSVLVINEFHFTTQFRIQQYCEITIKEYLQGHIYNIRRKKGIRTQREIISKRTFLVISQSRFGNMAGLLKRLLTKPETICRMKQSVSLYSVQTLPPISGEQSRSSKTLAYNLEKSVKCKT